jgi:hypothetical protein
MMGSMLQQQCRVAGKLTGLERLFCVADDDLMMAYTHLHAASGQWTGS